MAIITKAGIQRHDKVHVLDVLPGSITPGMLQMHPSSLSDLKENGCKSAWLAYISPLFRSTEQLLVFKIVKIYPYPITFSLRFFRL